MMKNVDSPLKSEIEVLCDVIELVGEKLQANEERFKQEELCSVFVKQDGNNVSRQNPFMVEYRAMLRDYHQALGKLQLLINTKVYEEQVSSLNDLRERFKIV